MPLEPHLREEPRKVLVEALDEDDTAAIESWLGQTLAVDIAETLVELEPQQAARVLAIDERGERAKIFGYLPDDAQIKTLAEMDRDSATSLVEAMSHDERADFVKALPNDMSKRLMWTLAHAEREDARRLASYEEETAGALMTSDYVTLRRDMTTAEAIDHLRRVAPDSETIYNAYVVDDNRHLLGIVTLRHLISATTPDVTVAELMRENVIHAHVDDDQEEVARTIARYDFIALPVLDDDNRLVGIVTADDAMDVVEAEATEDILLSATVGRVERDAGLTTLYRKRVGWLVMLVFATLLTGAALDYFEETISQHMGLLFFLPALIASAGNTGSQAATLMVRSLSTGEVVAGDWAKMLGREATVATALGITLAAAMLGVGLLHSGPMIALLVALTMFTAVLFGGMIGLSLPFVLSRLGLDPATASTPLVTSIADVGGVMIYFGFAAMLLPELSS